ncbi:MAG: OmpA family protein, partial [Candidatus Kapabacteria bacterium]|nr:OmpA family protein [Candidatus Kapabacteria bacterium]
TRSEEVALNTFLVTREEYQTYTKTIPKKRPYYFEPAMQVRAVDAEKNEQDMVTIRIEEVIGNSIRPLLPYVFFEENTDTLPARYNRIASTETSNFTVNNLRKRNTLQIYHHVLNIIGKRLREYPNAVLTLTGCNTDMDAEHGNTQLSKRRAEAVRDYLQQAWQVDAKRLVIKAQNLPRVPSSAKSQDGIDENRRVEIASSVAEVLQNIVLLDTTLRTESVSSLRIYPSVKSSAGIAAWRIRGSVLDTITKSFQSSTDSLPAAIEWNVNEQLAQAIEHPQKIGITMELRDRKDSVSTVTASTPVQLITKRDRERIDNKYVDTYSLILYDFGTYTHTAAHEKMLKYIRVHSTPKSTMIITGHTDRSGSNDYNRMLSTKRAEFTAKALNVPMSNVTGYGEEQELYDNNLPEGRMYNRTVNITVETPVE